jgi:hypothetical protein
MSQEITKRRLKGIRKALDHQKRRLEIKERQRQRLAESAARRAPPPRRKDWWDADGEHESEGSGLPARPARRASSTVSLGPEPEVVGTVVEVRSADALVAHDGAVLRATLPATAMISEQSTRSPLAVGDRVQLQPTDGDQARIVVALPRRSALTRDVYDPSRRGAVHTSQVLAANIDQVIVVCSPVEPPFRPRLVDRYLVAASRDSLPVIVCLNKADLGVPERWNSTLPVTPAWGSHASSQRADRQRPCRIEGAHGREGLAAHRTLGSRQELIAQRARAGHPSADRGGVADRCWSG